MSSNLDKDKQKEEEEKRKRKEKKESQKRTEEENLKKINLQQSEKIRLNYVFNQLCELENEKSSDDDSKSKKYLQNIIAVPFKLKPLYGFWYAQYCKKGFQSSRHRFLPE